MEQTTPSSGALTFSVHFSPPQSNGIHVLPYNIPSRNILAACQNFDFMYTQAKPATRNGEVRCSPPEAAWEKWSTVPFTA